VISVYEADLVEGDLRPDNDETQAVRWFDPEELAALPTTNPTRATLATLDFVA
jgi:NADH pyrophosphatase NudC (nudix superfamily)